LSEHLVSPRERLLLPAKFRHGRPVALRQASVAALVTGRDRCDGGGLSHHWRCCNGSSSCNGWAAASCPKGMPPRPPPTGCCGLQYRPPETIVQRPSVAAPPPHETASARATQNGQAHARVKMHFLLGLVEAGFVSETNCGYGIPKRRAPWGWQCCHQVAVRRHAVDRVVGCSADCTAAAAAAAPLHGRPPASTLHPLVQHLLICLLLPASKVGASRPLWVDSEGSFEWRPSPVIVVPVGKTGLLCLGGSRSQRHPI